MAGGQVAVVRVEVCVTKYFPLRVQGCSRAGTHMAGGQVAVVRVEACVTKYFSLEA